MIHGGIGVGSDCLGRKRSIVVAGRKTSVSLEEPFWISLKEIAAIKQIRLRDLIAGIRGAGAANLSSAIRSFVVDYYRSLDTERQRVGDEGIPRAKRPRIRLRLQRKAKASIE
jgi:predicted DNA-binding ribbon-helix-helix protein